MTDFWLAAERITIERGGRIVIDDLSFRAGAGAALVVTGPNGSGKSTLLRTIAGLVHLASGRLQLHGGNAEKTLAEHCHYFGHLDGLKSALTVAENATFWRDFYRPIDVSTADGTLSVATALDEVGLDHLAHLPAAYLSAGQRRRLSLARLLVSRRSIWLLDEPTSALDSASEERLVACVNRHLSTGGVVIAATHAPLAFDTISELSLSPGVSV
jgi:heme exporter protein A